MKLSNILSNLKSDSYWKERIIAFLVTSTYVLGNLIELLSSKLVDDPPLIWIVAVVLGLSVFVVSSSDYKKYTPIVFSLFLYYINFNVIIVYAESTKANIEGQFFYLLAGYVFIVVTMQLLESKGSLLSYLIFEIFTFTAVAYYVRGNNPIFLHPLHYIIFLFILSGSFALSLQHIRLTQINPNSSIHFKNLTENARDISSLIDRNLKFIYVNKSVQDAIGFKSEELVGEYLLDSIPPDDHSRILTTIKSLEDEPEEKKSIEYQLRTKSGELLWVESIFGNFKNGQGFFADNYYFVETRNIEQRKLLEAELQEQLRIEALFLKYSNSLINLQRKQISSEIYKLLSEAAPKLEKDTIAVYSFVNEKLRLETVWFNIVGQVPINVLHTVIYNKEALVALLSNLLKQEILVCEPSKSQQELELATLFIKDKEDLKKSRIALLPLLSNNQLIGIAVTINKHERKREISKQITLLKLLGVMISNALARKGTEDKLAEVQNTNEAILKALPDWLFMVNKEGQFTRTNLVTNLTPYPNSTDLVGNKFHDVLPEGIATKFMDALFRVIETDTLFSFEYKDSSIIVGNWFKVIVAPFRLNEYLVIIRDITELKNAQEELEIKAQKLLQSNKELEEFAYVVSHDMKQPVRTVISYLNLLQKRYKDKLDEEAKDFIQIAIDGSNKMNLLILDILNYSRMDQVVEFSPNIHLDKIIKKVLGNIEAFISSNNVHLQVGSMPVVDGNETMLMELIQNLIENGIKYNRSEQKEIAVNATDKGTYWQFSFKDNGIGFEQKYADQIFKIFKRLHNDNEFKGSGIGLSICAKAVEKHGGKIWAEGELGKGSTFYFTLPK